MCRKYQRQGSRHGLYIKPDRIYAYITMKSLQPSDTTNRKVKEMLINPVINYSLR